MPFEIGQYVKAKSGAYGQVVDRGPGQHDYLFRLGGSDTTYPMTEDDLTAVNMNEGSKTTTVVRTVVSRRLLFFREADRQDLLPLPLQDASSLYALLIKSVETQFSEALKAHLSKTDVFANTVRYKPSLNLFASKLEADDDATMIASVYETHASAMQDVFGSAASSSRQFLQLYAAGRTIFERNVQAIIGCLKGASFARTYDYADIVELLTLTGGSTNREALQKRLGETGEIVLRYIALNPKTSFRYAMLLNFMHSERFKHDTYKRPNVDTKITYYNQGSVAFTLLTFSYLPASLIELEEWNEKAWYFFWKVIGSLMGLSHHLMPDTHAEGQKLINRLTEIGALGMNEEKKALLLKTIGK